MKRSLCLVSSHPRMSSPTSKKIIVKRAYALKISHEHDNNWNCARIQFILHRLSELNASLESAFRWKNFLVILLKYWPIKFTVVANWERERGANTRILVEWLVDNVTAIKCFNETLISIYVYIKTSFYIEFNFRLYNFNQNLSITRWWFHWAYSSLSLTFYQPIVAIKKRRTRYLLTVLLDFLMLLLVLVVMVLLLFFRWNFLLL